jgi:hypothetical protein
MPPLLDAIVPGGEKQKWHLFSRRILKWLGFPVDKEKPLQLTLLIKIC